MRLKHYVLGGNEAQLKLGLKYRDESRDNVNLNRSFTAAAPLSLTQVLGTFSDPNFYQDLAKGFEIGQQANHTALKKFESANPAMFKETTKPISDSLSNFNGGEKVASAYAMHTLDYGALRINAGLRLENTAVNFSGNAATTPANAAGKANGTQTVRRVNSTQNYTDLFPERAAPLRRRRQQQHPHSPSRAASPAPTTRISRRTSPGSCAPPARSSSATCRSAIRISNRSTLGISTSSASDYFGSSGVFSAGVFYKRITDFIYKRQFIYQRTGHGVRRLLRDGAGEWRRRAPHRRRVRFRAPARFHSGRAVGPWL